MFLLSKLRNQGSMAFVFLTSACGMGNSEPHFGNHSGQVQKEVSAESSDATPPQDSIDEESKLIVNGKPLLSSSRELESSPFRVYGLRTGLQDFLQGPAPIITFFRPEIADFFQVLRCAADVQIHGRIDSLEKIERGASDAEFDLELFRRNDFWRGAQQAGCVVVTQMHSAETLLDLNAEDGSFRYLARACVTSERIKHKDERKESCSLIVTLSPVVRDFRNIRTQGEKGQLKRIQHLQDKAAGLGLQLHELTIGINNALATCQQNEMKREQRLRVKNIVTQVIGVGVSLGTHLLQDPNALAAVRAGRKTWTQLFEETWKAKDDHLDVGKGLAEGLQHLFQSAKDFPLSCSESSKFQDMGTIAVKELEMVHKEFAQVMDVAENEQKNMKQGEAPK